MKNLSIGLLLACACTSPLPSLLAGQVEADFNDMFLGNTMTRNNSASQNNLNVNTGLGFLPNVPSVATGGLGEYNTSTGVVQFEKGDLVLPSGASPGYISEQKSPVDPLAQGSGGGVVFGSSTNTSGEIFTRFQDRSFATAMTNPVIWFSFLFRVDGPHAQGQLMFNPANDADNTTSGFGISIGHPSTPGAIAINATMSQTPQSLVSAANSNILYYDGIGGAGDLNGNGQVDGVSVGKEGISGIRTHLIIGRITQNTAAGGEDIIEVWLDPANGADPTGESPILTYTGDRITPAGLTAIGFKGTRQYAPSPVGGPYTTGGHFSLDHVRLSDQDNALQFVTGNVPVDPKLVVAPGSPGNFNFRGVYGAGNPLAAQPITMTLRNDGATQPIDITNIALTGTNTPTIFTVTNLPTLPLTLAPGATTSFTVEASSTVFEAGFTNSVKVSTSQPDQDKTFTAAATFYSAGSRVNQNGSLDLDIGGWTSDNFTGDDTPPLIVNPGFLGTSGKVFMKGAGETGSPDNLSQTLLNGAKDWELAFFFSPLTDAQFLQKTGSAATGTDRLVQVIIQSNNLVPVPAFSTFGKWTDLHNGVAGMINLAYLPAMGGFRLYNGSNWVSAGLPTLTGPADQNNVYLVRIKGTGFGTSAAKYTVSVSQPNSTITAATSSELAIWSSTSGQSNTPGAYTFTTGDVSASGTSAKTASYSLDEVSFFSVAARDPDRTISGQNVLSHEGITTAGGVTITNTGFSADLVVSGLTFQHSHIFSTTQVFPVSIPAGTSIHVPVTMVNGFVPGANGALPNNAARGNVTITTNVTLAPSATASLLGSYTNSSNLLGNWNFEVTGIDPGGDSDSFAVWAETPNPTNSKDAAGLVTGSAISAYLGQNTGISGPLGVPIGNFVLECDFAFKDAGSDNNSFYMEIGGGPSPHVPIFYRTGEFAGWSVTEGEGTTEIIPGVYHNPSTDLNGNFSLNDAGDTKNVYKLRFTGKGWNTTSPTYLLQILDSAGEQVGISEELSREVVTPTSGASYVSFLTPNVATAGFWVDNVRLGAIVESAVIVTGFSKTSGGFNISWSNGGNPIVLERSTTLLPDSWITLPLGSADFAAGTYNDSTAPNDKAFYRIKRP